VDTIHQRDKRTDRQTDTSQSAKIRSKDRTYALRRAVKIAIELRSSLVHLIHQTEQPITVYNSKEKSVPLNQDYSYMMDETK